MFSVVRAFAFFFLLLFLGMVVGTTGYFHKNRQFILSPLVATTAVVQVLTVSYKTSNGTTEKKIEKK